MAVTTQQLGAAIKICGLKGRELAEAILMPVREGKAFVKAVREAFAKLA